MTTRPYVQVQPRAFPEPQQRALNDALGRLSSAVGSATSATILTPSVVPGQAVYRLSVNQTSSAYGVAVTTTWFTQWRVTSQTSSVLSLEFSNAPSDGDVFRVVLS